MNAILGNFLVTPMGFSLNTFFGNISSRGQVWGFDTMTAFGMVALVYAVICFIKALSTPQGGGGYWLKFFIGLVIGGFLVFYGRTGVHSLSGPDTFHDLTGNFLASPIVNLPVHMWIHLL